jgi:ring-1,2-phenylacetyl-CoA epoxidase subunit PaaD
VVTVGDVATAAARRSSSLASSSERERAVSRGERSERSVETTHVRADRNPAVVEPVETTQALAWKIAATVVDPEMPMLTLEDLGVLRSVTLEGDHVVATITPTYSGCPAMATMRDDLVRRLEQAGFQAEVRVSLSPAWSSDWITDRGRRALVENGISAPGAAPRRDGPVALTLLPTPRAVSCPRCGEVDVELTSEFGATACKAMYRCRSCLEPFEHVKEI